MNTATKILVGVIVAIAIMWVPVEACERVKVEYGVYTQHLSSDRYSLNEYNEFLGVQCDWIQFSKFTNSYHLPSHSIGVSVQSDWVGMGVGVIHGYGEYLQYFPEWMYRGDLLYYFAPEINVGVGNVSKALGLSSQWLKNEGIEDVMLVGRLFGEVVSVSLAVVW